MNSPKNYVPSVTGQRYEQSFAQIVQHFVHTQCSFKAGLKKCKDKGLQACKEELEQLLLRETFKPLMPSDMSREDKREALESTIFLKEKRDGRLKARACADGRKQRGEIAKEDAASPTVSLEAALTTATIDAKEGRDVAVVDIPNAFIQTKMDDKVVMKLRGKLAEIMVVTAPELSLIHI